VPPALLPGEGGDRLDDPPAATCQARRQLTVYRLRDHQAEIMAEPVVEPFAPMVKRVPVAEHGFDPDLAARTDLDGTGRHIVCPEIECAAALQLEARMMPMAVRMPSSMLPRSSGKSHMRAAVVER